MKNDKTALFETMPVGKALLTMAIPTIVSQLITMVYNIADTFFIGLSNDPYKVAAASIVGVLFFMLNSLSNLFGVGGGSLLSRLLGEKREELPVLVQANASFFCDNSAARAMRMLQKEQIHLLGSDCHNMRNRQPNLGQAIKRIQKHCGNEVLENLAAFQCDVLGV